MIIPPPAKQPVSSNSGTLVHKVYQLYAFLYQSVAIFPKHDRYTLGLRLEHQVLELFELIMLAKEKDGASKLLIIKKADHQVTMLKLFVRLANEVKALPEKRYIEIEDRLIEIGKMLGGWIKSLKVKQETKEPVTQTDSFEHFGEPRS